MCAQQPATSEGKLQNQVKPHQVYLLEQLTLQCNDRGNQIKGETLIIA